MIIESYNEKYVGKVYLKLNLAQCTKQESPVILHVVFCKLISCQSDNKRVMTSSHKNQL